MTIKDYIHVRRFLALLLKTLMYVYVRIYVAAHQMLEEFKKVGDTQERILRKSLVSICMCTIYN